MLNLDLTPHQAIERIELHLGLTDDELASALNASLRTIARWRTGETYPQHESRERLNALLSLEERLQESFTTIEAIQLWMRDENLYLGELSPTEAIRAGRIDRAEAALGVLEWGIIV